MKRIATSFLCLCMLLSLLPATAVQASDIIASGICGENLTWVLNAEGTLTISGNGPMRKGAGSQWESYGDKIVNVIVEEGVTTICDWAFGGFYDNVETVILPAGLAEIGAGAFSQCDSLKAISIPGGVTKIGEDAFYACKGLESINIPSSVTDIGRNAFALCDNLTGIRVDENNQHFSSDGRGVLFNINKTELIQAPGAISRGYTIPDGVEKIGYMSFAGCDELISITIPDTVTEIDMSAFDFCEVLKQITFAGNAPVITGNIFLLVDATAYYPAGNITWTDNIKQDYDGSIIWVEGQPEHEIPLLASGTCGSSIRWELDIGGTLVISGTGDMQDYDILSSSPWAEYRFEVKRVIIEDGITSVGAYSFDMFFDLEEIVIADSVTKIGEYAFKHCASLQSVVLPKSVKHLGAGTFFACSSLTSATVPVGSESIEDSTFYGCNSLKSVFIPDSVVDIGVMAFQDCDNLETVYYSGTRQQWQTIEIDAWNKPILSANIICEGTQEECVHSEQRLVGRDPSCTEPGLTEGSMCSVCGEILSLQEIIPATGHTFGQWQITKEPVDGIGQKQRLCHCGYSEQADFEMPLTDVPNSKYYSKPVFWAYENGITKGKTATEFQLDAECTRKQIVTFLWRAAGQPEPKSMENPYVDVKQDRFTKAILWAAEQGITSGTGDGTTFSPEQACTRKQIVMFLWRFNGKPAPQSTSNPFTDVKQDRFTNAILWAFEQGITTGKTATTFEPEAVCTRGQIVTFLYRSMA